MTKIHYLLLALVIILILLPPKWDPAIRIKEWQLKRRSGADKVHIFDARDGEM